MVQNTSFRRDDPNQAFHTIRMSDDGIVEIGIYGVWNAGQADLFFAELQPIRDRARQRFNSVATVITVALVQSPIVAMHVRNRAIAIKRPGDRTAIVVATFLSKLQITRVASGKDFGVFTTAAAARAWLLQPAV